ncbi:hypothetical protein QWJ07_31410 [Frankia sp. RB7]|nr:hypothetical protein [Frankia sp. RB7]
MLLGWAASHWLFGPLTQLISLPLALAFPHIAVARYSIALSCQPVARGDQVRDLGAMAAVGVAAVLSIGLVA